MASIQGPTRNQDILHFWNRHQRQIYKLCRKKMPREVPISDLMQNVYIRLHTHFDEIRDLKSPFQWLAKIAENVCNDEMRRFLREQMINSSFFRYSREKEIYEEEQVCAEQSAEYFLEKIEPNMGTLVDLHFLKGFSIGELSEISGIKKSTVAKQLRRSISKIRENIFDFKKAS